MLRKHEQPKDSLLRRLIAPVSPPSAACVPKHGDVVTINLSATGSAKSGRRPAVVLSPVQGNDRDGRAVLYPITS